MNRHSNRHTSPKRGASCVQSFDDSLDFAIRMTYRISLRSSSLWEPRHPLLKVLVVSFLQFGQRPSVSLQSDCHATPTLPLRRDGAPNEDEK